MLLTKKATLIIIATLLFSSFHSQINKVEVDNSKDMAISKMSEQKFMGVAVAPSHMIFSTDYGRRDVQYLTITNDTKKVNSFRISFEDVEMDLNGSIIKVANNEEVEFGLKNWISASPNFVTLLPGEKVKMEIIVKIPNTEEAHRAAWCMGSVDLVKERKEITPSGSDKEMTMGVKTTFGFQIFFYQNPPDLKVNEVEILDFSFSYDDVNKFIHLLAENRGRGVAHTKAYVELNELTTGYYEKLDLQVFNILPGRQREFNFKLPGKMPKGKYSFMGVLDFGSDDELKAASKEIIIQ
jgi:hypothetical protein